MSPPGPLQQAIAQLEAFRATLGDAAIDEAAAALRRHSADAKDPDEAPQRLRQVSVLFADVANSTAMLSRVGAHDAMDLLGRALEAFADAVRQWDGEVLRFTGDGIKAAFGTRGLREDEAERAVRAGLQILAAASRHADEVRKELRIDDFGVRVGIHTGPVLLGGGVEAERGAMGHAVNLAARMEQSAPVGRLRISEGTWAQVRGLFVAQAQPPLLIKGHDEPLRTWLVSGVAAGVEPTVQRGIEGLDTPMIGRGDELAHLVAMHGRTRAEGRATAALLLGDAGMGKTRLRRELLGALGLREGEPGLLQARAHPSSLWQPYGLLRQLLARALGIQDDLSAEAARKRLQDGLAPWLTDAAGAARIGHLIGFDFGDHAAVQALGPSGLRAQAFAALRDVLHAMARAQPTLLVLDDLHWADDASLAFVQSLLEPAAVPLMVLLLSRPTLAERAIPLEMPLAPDGLRLALAPLPATSSETLLDALLQAMESPPASLRRMLLDRAEGNPFFLEALVRMLIDDGVIDAGTRPWTLRSERLATLQVPPTLVGVLQARLDALPPGELAALQSASIIGPVFWGDALASVDANAPAMLESLRRRHLVVARNGSAFGHTTEQAFAHQLLHETTYDTVLKGRRRDGHARVARWLAGRVTDRAGEFLALTAEHYERAGDSAQALEYWDRAALDASARFASSAAVQFIERALAQPALTDTRWRYALMSSRYTKLDFMGRDEAAAAREALATYAEACDDDAMRADILIHLMLKADHEGEPQRARELALRTLAHAARANDERAAPSAALAHGELAWLAVQDHHYDEVAAQVAAGIGHARVSARVPRRYGGYAGYEQQLRTIAIESLIQQERYVDALDAIAAAAAAVGDAASTYDRFSFVQRQGVALRRLGRYEEGGALAHEQRELAERAGVARLMVPSLLALVDVAHNRGDPAAVDALLVEADRVATVTDGGFDLPRVREQQGHAALARGAFDEARAAWEDAIGRLLAQERPDLAHGLRCELALLDLRQGRVAQARDAVEGALAFAAADGRPRCRALAPDALLACARVLQVQGDPRAIALLEDLRFRLDEQLAAIREPRDRERLLANVSPWRDVERALREAGIEMAEGAR